METGLNTIKSETVKQVRWGAVSVLEFDVSYNASAVPESGGPPVGLIGQPTYHSYSILPVEDDANVTDSEYEGAESDRDTEVAMLNAPRSLGYSRRNRKQLWLNPMERARILAEDQAFAMDDIALICQDVRATLDLRAISRWDEVTELLKVSRAPRQDANLLRCDIVYGSSREKVLLY
ncbi:unnamed protein product [Peronospora belbahrii]|nr:unnamed protein product [Peronospora belbahrii]